MRALASIDYSLAHHRHGNLLPLAPRHTAAGCSPTALSRAAAGERHAVVAQPVTCCMHGPWSRSLVVSVVVIIPLR
jgi:hypothetical protein